VLVHDFRGGKSMRVLDEFPPVLGLSHDLVVGPGGKYLAVAGMRPFLRKGAPAWGVGLWDLRARPPGGPPPRPDDLPDGPAFSPSGQRVFGVGDRLWDTASPVGSLAISPSGRRLFAAGDRSVRAWDVATGRQVLTFPLRGPAGRGLAAG